MMNLCMPFFAILPFFFLVVNQFNCGYGETDDHLKLCKIPGIGTLCLDAEVVELLSLAPVIYYEESNRKVEPNLTAEDANHKLYPWKNKPKFFKVAMSIHGLLFILTHKYRACERHVSYLIKYFLLESGIEQNPGPRNETPPSKRVRKSGVQYKMYLTNSVSFDTAPEALRSSLTTENRQNAESGNDCDTSPSTSNSASLPIQTESRETIIESASSSPVALATDYFALDTEEQSESDSGNENNADEYDTDIYWDAYELFDDEDIDEEISASEEKDENINDHLIYPGAQLTLGDSMLLIMTFVMNHNLTGEAFRDLLDLIKLHCPESNLLPLSNYSFKQYFQNLKHIPKKHFYCSYCLMSVQADDLTCPNSVCGKPLGNTTTKSFFVEVSLKEQLSRMFSKDFFRQHITERVLSNENIDVIGDITEGCFYRSANSDVKKPFVTLTWNTDGVPLFKSSKTSMWPLFFAVNELPFKKRRQPENLLLAGLWIGNKKPEMLTFLQPFIEDLSELEEGIEIPESESKDSFTLFGYLTSGTADLPAKCTVSNMIQFNGKYSCPHCLQPGQTAASGKGSCHVFPFEYGDPTGPRRTHEGVTELAESATPKNPKFGIKGPCWFSKLKIYNFVTSSCIDYMHCCLLGIMKKMLTLWFSKEHSAQKYSFSGKADVIDRRLSKLKPPLFIKRAPRPFSEMKYWKASEFRSFLLFYGPVILLDILTETYYKHFLLFSEAIFILLQENISRSDIERTEYLLENFVASFERLYDKRFMTLNIHLLLHLPENVRQQGPLWGYSCFPFEDSNGFLLKLVKGTQSVHAQLLDSISIIHGLPYLRSKVEKGSNVDFLLKRMTSDFSLGMKCLRGKIYSLGKTDYIRIENLSSSLYVALANFLGIAPSGIVRKFKRLKIKDLLLHSIEYTRVKVRNSYTILFREGNDLCCGVIHHFLAYQETNTDKLLILALVTKLSKNFDHDFPYDEVTETRLMSHMKVYVSASSINPKIIIDVEDIDKMCVNMYSEHDGSVYVCASPNAIEKE